MCVGGRFNLSEALCRYENTKLYLFFICQVLSHYPTIGTKTPLNLKPYLRLRIH